MLMITVLTVSERSKSMSDIAIGILQAKAILFIVGVAVLLLPVLIWAVAVMVQRFCQKIMKNRGQDDE